MNLHRNSLIYTAVALSAFYVVLAVLVAARLLTEFDLSSIEWLQTLIPRLFDLPFSVLSILGSFEITAALVFVILFFFFKPRHRLLLFILFLAIVAVEGLGKEIIPQPGPPDDLQRMVDLFSMPTGGVYTPYSFPSGHAARSAFIVLLFFAWVQHSLHTGRLKSVLVALLVIAELIMLVSRVYLGEHWSTDVIGGTALGLLCALPSLQEA